MAFRKPLVSSSLAHSVLAEEEENGGKETNSYTKYKASPSLYLSEIFEASKNLPTVSTELGSIQLGAKEISRRCESLRQTIIQGDKSGNGDNRKAHILLAKSGIDLELLEANVKSLKSSGRHRDLRSTVSEESTRKSTGVYGFLREKKKQSILSSIDESWMSATDDFNTFINMDVFFNWRKRTEEICETLGVISSHNTSRHLSSSKRLDSGSSRKHREDIVWGNAPLGKLVLGSLTDTQFSAEDERYFKEYSKIVVNLNNHRENNSLCSVASNFYLNAVSLDGDYSLFSRLWKILRNVVDLTDPVTLKPTGRTFASCYQNWNPAGNPTYESISLFSHITSSSLSYLQEQFFEYINQTVSSNRYKAQVGGNVSIDNTIQSFLNVKHCDKNKKWDESIFVSQGLPIWGIVYYMIRCGYIKQANDVVAQYSHLFKAVDNNFPTYMNEFATSPNGKLSRRSQESIHNYFIQNLEYQTDARKVDPFQFAIYKIIGRCNVVTPIPSSSLIFHSFEDWIWVNLMLCNNELYSGVSMGHFDEKYTLQNVQSAVLNIGKSQKMDSSIYLQMLLLSGLYEQSIETLYNIKNEVQAVHFAIALSYYGLLRWSDFNPDNRGKPILTFVNGKPMIDFVQLVGRFTRKFRTDDSELAVDYIMLFTLPNEYDWESFDLTGTNLSENQNDNAEVLEIKEKNEERIKICHSSLRELILETRQFSKLLGDLQSNGSKISGKIEKRKRLAYIADEEEFIKSISKQAAVQAKEDGRTSDAILLFQLSKDYDAVLELVNYSISEEISAKNVNNAFVSAMVADSSFATAAQSNPTLLAKQLLANTSTIPLQNSSTRRARLIETCKTLLKVTDAFAEFSERKFSECINILKTANVLPIALNVGGSHNETISQIREFSKSYNNRDESIIRNTSLMLLIALKSMFEISKELKTKKMTPVINADEQIKELKQYAKNCMIFAGMNPYHISKEVYGQLIALEASL